MVNIKSIQQSIIDDVQNKVCDFYGLEKSEVIVGFKSGGDIKVTLIPYRLIEHLEVKVEVSFNENDPNANLMPAD